MCKTAGVCKNVRFSRSTPTAQKVFTDDSLNIRKMIFPVFNNVFGIWLNLAKGQIIVDKKFFILLVLTLETSSNKTR